MDSIPQSVGSRLLYSPCLVENGRGGTLDLDAGSRWRREICSQEEGT